MEDEVQQEGGGVPPPSNKQAFIYKKNATSTTAKAITRKMRQSQIPSALVEQNYQQHNNSIGGDSSGRHQRESASKPTMDATRSSQNEAETIATQGGHNRSPSGQALS